MSSLAGFPQTIDLLSGVYTRVGVTCAGGCAYALCAYVRVRVIYALAHMSGLRMGEDLVTLVTCSEVNRFTAIVAGSRIGEPT